jgi:hypothetical protein
MNKNIFFSIFGVVLILIVVFVLISSNKTNNDLTNSKGDITIYKSPTCGCCVKYSAYLKDQGYNVEIITAQDMQSIKNKHQIPSNLESCHTSIVGEYFVEGHVPIEVIQKLLEEKPNIDGISLPEMPAGTPGMPGTKSEEWQIYSLKDGQVNKYISI